MLGLDLPIFQLKTQWNSFCKCGIKNASEKAEWNSIKLAGTEKHYKSKINKQMITLKNRNTRPTNMLWDPFFVGPRRVVSRPAHAPTSRINTNIIKNENGFQIQLAAPGFKKDQLKLEIKDERLVISLQVEKPETQDENRTESSNTKVLTREFQFRAFEKSFIIPKGIDLNEIKATYEAGILSVDLVKKPTFVKTVEIH